MIYTNCLQAVETSIYHAADLLQQGLCKLIACAVWWRKTSAPSATGGANNTHCCSAASCVQVVPADMHNATNYSLFYTASPYRITLQMWCHLLRMCGQTEAHLCQVDRTRSDTCHTSSCGTRKPLASHYLSQCFVSLYHEPGNFV